jgi:hypothetical protein
VEGEADHLDEVAQRALAAVVLPVGVGGEAHGGVEGEVRRHAGLALRVERQDALGALEQVEDEAPDGAERQHRQGVGEPVLLLALIDPGERVAAPLDRPEDGREEGALAGEDAGHEAADRPREGQHDDGEEDDLGPAGDGQGRSPQNRSGRTRA